MRHQNVILGMRLVTMEMQGKDIHLIVIQVGELLDGV